MEHKFKGNDELPMYFKVNTREKELAFATDNIVMENDTVTGCGIQGTVKEILEERPSKGNWSNIGHNPTFYKVKLY